MSNLVFESVWINFTTINLASWTNPTLSFSTYLTLNEVSVHDPFDAPAHEKL
jgi:hypothetical protein